MGRSARHYGAVAAGSALGAIARHLCSASVAMLGEGFPWGTLAANVLGSFIIGFYAMQAARGGHLWASPEARLFVMTGFCGGFTTFSAFSLETLLLLESGRADLAAGNIALSLCLWLGAVRLGEWAGRRLGRPAQGPLR